MDEPGSLLWVVNCHPSSLSLSLSLFLSPCRLSLYHPANIVCRVYGHGLLICSVLPAPLGVIVHTGCCVQKTNGSVSSGPGKDWRGYRHTCTRLHQARCSACVCLCVSLSSHTWPAVTHSPLLHPHVLYLYTLCVNASVCTWLRSSSANHTTSHRGVWSSLAEPPMDHGSDGDFYPAAPLYTR